MHENIFIQTEAERRRHEAIVIQWIEKAGQCLYECFSRISQDQEHLQKKMASYGRMVDNILLMHVFLLQW